MLKANYHTHLVYCNHAVGYAKDYVKEAINNNFIELGITDHAPILERFMTKEEYDKNWCHQNMKMDTVNIYLNDVKAAQEEYKDKIKVLIGFETEYLPKEIEHYKWLRSLVDYLNLGIHFFIDGDNVMNSYSEITYKNVDKYAETAILGMETGLYNTLVHPDLFMFDYKNINGERKFDEAAIKASRRIIESAIKNNVYLEVNCNGLKNSLSTENKEDWVYPYYEFWELVKNEYKDAKIIIGADAHNPKHLANENVLKTIEFVESIGLKVYDFMEINH